MAAIKRRFLRSVNSLILFLISLLGFTTSCIIKTAYGSPHADFVVHGTITSVTDSKPIPDIIVEMRQVHEEEEDASQSRLVATGFSYYSGSYDLMAESFPDDQTYKLRFIDTDGPLNGEYETLDTTVVFKDPKFANGDGDWYSGFAEKELNIQLKPKE